MYNERFFSGLLPRNTRNIMYNSRYIYSTNNIRIEFSHANVCEMRFTHENSVVGSHEQIRFMYARYLFECRARYAPNSDLNIRYFIHF